MIIVSAAKGEPLNIGLLNGYGRYRAILLADPAAPLDFVLRTGDTVVGATELLGDNMGLAA